MTNKWTYRCGEKVITVEAESQEEAETMTARTEAEITAELEAFEAQFRPAAPPPGTPFRKQLWREACAAAHALACQPENIERRLALLAELRAAKRSATAKRAAVIRAADPTQRERARIFRALRAIGFKRECTSGKSAYYRRNGMVVRVSDHEVPETDERRWNMDNGGRSWANSRWSFVLGDWQDADEWLEEVKEAIDD
jgi:hypothetical protein